MRRAAPALLLVLAACSSDLQAEGRPVRWVDLTHAFGEDTVYWPTAPGFKHTVDAYGVTPKGYFYASFSFQASEHGGTHMDAPIHFSEGRLKAHEVPVERLVGPAAVVDVKEACAKDRDYLVSVADFEGWERDHGRLPEGAIVLLNTGFHAFWPDRERYMGTAERGPEAVAKLHFPGLHPDAARWLVANRKVNAVGLDTPSIDHGPSQLFETHQVLAAAEIPAFENVANLDALPAKGAFVIALPMKIRDGSGGPLRIVAQVP
jgi:kynurenine formamidase